MSLKFSLLLNSRGRPALLKNLLDSLTENTRNLNNIECLISCDRDDLETYNFASSDNYSRLFSRYEFIENEKNLHRRINNLVHFADGKYLWILNDDTEVITKDWDKEAWDILESAKSDIVYGHIKCTSIDKERGSKYSSFPIISKFTTDILGHFITPELVGLGGDVYLWRIFNEINQVVDLPVVVRHILHETIESVVNCDNTAREMRQNTYRSGVDCWNIDISESVAKLSKLLE